MNTMRRRSTLATIGLLTGTASLLLTGCGASGGSSGNGPGGKVTHVSGAPDWCGTKKISFALLDGFGGNSWRLVTTASTASAATAGAWSPPRPASRRR
jgi:ribose transport system substrate-binding protein